MSTMHKAPEGFQLLDLLSDGFNAALQPLFVSYAQQKLSFGMYITERHLNRMHMCHGGVYMTLMDFASSVQLCVHVGKFVSTPTINFSLDFMVSAKEGDFIFTDIDVLKRTRSFAFTQGFVRCEDQVLARANATFKLPSDIAQASGVSVTDFAKHYGIEL